MESTLSFEEDHAWDSTSLDEGMDLVGVVLHTDPLVASLYLSFDHGSIGILAKILRDGRTCNIAIRAPALPICCVDRTSEIDDELFV